jgi:hypothetical protein
MKNWDKLTSQQKKAFGDRFITHESNLSAWDKNFDELSPLKKCRVINFLPSDTSTLNYVIS